MTATTRRRPSHRRPAPRRRLSLGWAVGALFAAGVAVAAVFDFSNPDLPGRTFTVAFFGGLAVLLGNRGYTRG